MIMSGSTEGVKPEYNSIKFLKWKDSLHFGSKKSMILLVESGYEHKSRGISKNQRNVRWNFAKSSSPHL